MEIVTTKRSRSGYILQEIIVGVVIFGIAMVPIMRGLRMLPDVGAAVGEQSRREAWRSAADQAVLEGLDPSQTALLHSVTSSEVSHRLVGSMKRADLSSRAGKSRISVLSADYIETAEERAIPAGIEIGAGVTPVPPRVDPLPPLPPIRLSAPTLNPTNGSMVPVMSLSSSGVAGAPYTLSIESAGPGSDLIFLRETGPSPAVQSGLGSAKLIVDAVNLAQSVRGQTWAEYAGNPAVDVAVALEDGRTRWLVAAGPRTQVYEPSDPVDFVFGVDVGRPTYSVAGFEYPSGSTVPIDYSTAIAVAAGRSDASITYPEDVRQRFGSQWASVAPAFSWSFGSFPGDSSAGNTATFYGAAFRPLWNDSQTLAAAPLSALGGLRLLMGSWTLERKRTALEPPERVASFYDGSTDAPGWIDFSAPNSPSVGGRVGRPEVNGVESVDASLSVPVLP